MLYIMYNYSTQLQSCSNLHQCSQRKETRIQFMWGKWVGTKGLMCVRNKRDNPKYTKCIDTLKDYAHKIKHLQVKQEHCEIYILQQAKHDGL